MSKPIDSSCRVEMPSSASTQPTSHKKQVSVLQDIVIGSISGVAAVSLLQPMIYFKNLAQATTSNTPTQGFEKNPRIWYRGVGGLAASVAPTAAIQTAAHGVLGNVLDPFLASTIAGASSAMVVCPTETIMIQQQRTGKGFWTTAKQIGSMYGFSGLYRGLMPTSIREGAFTGAYLGAVPKIKEKIQAFGIHSGIAQVTSGVIAGTIAATFSHPFDTFKTRIQGDFSLSPTLKGALLKNSPFAGLGWRVAMVSTATTVMPFVQEKLHKRLE